MQIIGISGVRGSGKSLLAKALEPYGFNRVSLAGPLKEYCQRDFGLTNEQLYGSDKETPTGYIRTDGSPLTARDIMIRCGVYYRSIDPLFWCKKLEETMIGKNYHQNQFKFVIDDIRFLNEIDYFKKQGAKFVRIERLPELNVFKQAMDDLSETELNNYKDWDGHLLPEFNKHPRDLEQFAEYIITHL